MNTTEPTALLALSYRYLSTFGYDLPTGLVSTWIACGPHFQRIYDIDTDSGADALVFWWLSDGYQEFPGIRNILDKKIAADLHLQHLDSAFQENQLGLTPLLRLILRNRDDLRASFPDDKASLLNFWVWWLTEGKHEFSSIFEAVKGKQYIEILTNYFSASPVFQFEMQRVSYAALQKIDFSENTSEIRSFFEKLYFSSLRNPKVLSSGLPPILSLIYKSRTDLEVAFDLNTTNGFADFWDWWFENGQGEYFENGNWIELEQLSALLSNLPSDPGIEDGNCDVVRFKSLVQLKQITARNADSIRQLLGSIHFNYLGYAKVDGEPTPLMALIYRNRPDLRATFDLQSLEGRTAFWGWWLENGQGEYLGNGNWIELEQLSALLSNLSSDPGIEDGNCDVVRFKSLVQLKQITARNADSIRQLLGSIHFNYLGYAKVDGEPTPLMALIYRNRPDLRATFDIQSLEGRTAFWEWWTTYGQAEYFADTGEVVAGITVPVVPAAEAASEAREEAAKHAVTNASTSGVSLVGYPRGEFGLGEDIRLLRASLNEVQIKPTVVNAPWTIMARQAIDEPSVEADVATFDGDVMIYVMPAFDTLTLLNKVGPSAFSARRKIGFWQWELERFPPPARMAMELVDEIWCHSEHSARAFRGATDKPVIRVPLPVMVPELPRVSRSNFGLEDDSFVVFTSFDGASSISRKNPLGAVLAFQSAFPRETHRKARLIVKAMNVHDDSLWRECMRKAAQDPRIIIRNTVMDRLEYYELLQCCDVVLSLHRAEGFGRLMAEAMALGIPVVASAYSGNMDFMNDKNSWLVSGETLPVLFGDYPFYQDQIWFEPDVGSAAEALRDCESNAEKRGQFIIAAKQTMDRYSTQNCGREYLKLLKSRASK
ncbi:glycosyltransferase family 4 protein [Rhizobium rhizogenes]|uniref:glycosyltransferase family 4 protein n=2 Tax=Rhizobium TaxID=379 RepID=UPI0006457C9F|nr:glycosyltransferase family 4 protein [Rhizobium rhizogenes]NTI24150.1 glycosyltransferase family 4 protein [Rhizobium rhizogenes]QTG03979.1 glycosyltransferase family 4 protein [Rhizobium rhizogenes]